VQTVLLTVSWRSEELNAAAEELMGRPRPRQRSTVKDALWFADWATGRAATATAQARETLTIPALVAADPPSLANGDRFGDSLAALIGPEEDEVAALRRYADDVRRAPSLPHPNDATAFQVAHTREDVATRTALVRILRVCGIDGGLPFMGFPN
jgi:hypothetical protein